MAERKRGRPRGGERITYREAAALLGVSETTIYAWVREGYLPAYEMPSGYHKLWRSVCIELRDDREKG